MKKFNILYNGKKIKVNVFPGDINKMFDGKASALRIDPAKLKKFKKRKPIKTDKYILG